MPARAAYAAAEALVFPVLAHATMRAPRSAALETASVMPLSLNEAVGFNPSYFTKRWKSPPSSLTIPGASIKGVPPSFREITGVSSETGRNRR